MFKHLFTGLLIFSFFIKSLIVLSQSILDPNKIIRNITNRIFFRFKHENDIIRHNPNYVRTIIREEFLPYVHIKYIGTAILGKYNQNINKKQREFYFIKFNEYLEYMYSQILVSFFSNQKYSIEYKNSFQINNFIITRIIIVDNIFSIHLDFQWKRSLPKKEWKIYNIMVEGIGMLETKKKEWISILERGGIENLIKYLHTISSKPIKLKNELYSKEKIELFE